MLGRYRSNLRLYAAQIDVFSPLSRRVPRSEVLGAKSAVFSAKPTKEL
jgi:hypothetical protein